MLFVLKNYVQRLYDKKTCYKQNLLVCSPSGPLMSNQVCCSYRIRLRHHVQEASVSAGSFVNNYTFDEKLCHLQLNCNLSLCIVFSKWFLAFGSSYKQSYLFIFETNV